ncbi:hypothetical protein E2C01_027188 [Portunus trituberculatus]|uniref:Uncharacterized protein n=1 Tax=Portunus trituberculatus TaxID=210409 RepID=A0A5B7ELA5_PORTR|nr:hypothetical protein [Portunus trituberculatus]
MRLTSHDPYEADVYRDSARHLRGWTGFPAVPVNHYCPGEAEGTWRYRATTLTTLRLRSIRRRGRNSCLLIGLCCAVMTEINTRVDRDNLRRIVEVYSCGSADLLPRHASL